MSGSRQSGGRRTGPKVLRIGIVQRGKIIEERELRRRESVSVGSADRATFTVSSETLPKHFVLFEYDGKNYFLRFEGPMDARVQLAADEDAVGFEKLRARGKVVRRKDGEAVALSDESRGKVMIGDVTVLFQFKSPVAAPVRPVLPPEIRGSVLQNVDAQFTAIFVAVALIQVSLVAYARSLPYIEPTSIDQIDQSYQRLIMPDRLPEPLKEQIAEPGGEENKAPEKKSPPKKATKKKVAKKAGGDGDGKKAPRSKEALRKQVAGKGLLAVLGAKNSRGGGALQDVFEEGGGAVGDLGEAFSGVSGVDIAGSGEGGTRGAGNGDGVDIGELGTAGGGGGRVSSGKKTEAAIRGRAQAESPDVDGELSQAQISRVMRRQLKALRDCYERALKRNRGLKGKIVIRFEIMETGRTSNVEFDDLMGSGDVVSCIRRRAKYWRFPKPEGGSVFVSYPIVFTPSS